MASPVVGSLIYIEDLTQDWSSRMNSEVYKNILSANLQGNASKLIGNYLIVQQDNDPKHTAHIKEFIREKKWKVLDWPNQTPDVYQIDHAFHLLKRTLKGNSPETNCWKRITKDECNSLVMQLLQARDMLPNMKWYLLSFIEMLSLKIG